MVFTLFDLILVAVIMVSVGFGYALGLIQSIGALVGVVVGGWLAGLYYESFSTWLSQYIPGGVAVSSIVAFIILFTIINRLIGLIFYVLDRVYHILTFIPFVKGINRIGGGVIGFLEGVLGLGLMLYFVSRFAFSEWLTEIMTQSRIANALVDVGGLLSPLLPDLLNQLKSFMS